MINDISSLKRIELCKHYYMYFCLHSFRVNSKFIYRFQLNCLNGQLFIPNPAQIMFKLFEFFSEMYLVDASNGFRLDFINKQCIMPSLIHVDSTIGRKTNYP